MGYESGIFLMIFIITFFMLLSLHRSTHILIAESPLNVAEDINVHGIQQLYFKEEKANGFDRKIEKVSGEDENAEKESLILEKFRALLGLISFSIRKPRNGDSEYMSPAPSPAPAFKAEAPAPVPVLHIHPHSHPPPSHLHANLPPHKIPKEDRNDGRFKRILVAVLVSAGAAFVVCVLGLIWFFRRFRKHNKKTGRMMSVYSKKGGTRSRSKYVSSQNSAAKVSSNPGLDLFYLNSLGMDLEHETTNLKQNPENVNISSHSTQKFTLPGMEEPEESNQEATKPESDNASSSSTREIVSVHDDVESRIYESDGASSQRGDKIIHIKYHSSDDDSFHSLCESHSSNLRLSNASAGSLSDTSEIFSLNVSTKKSPYASFLSNSPHLPINPTSQDLNSAHSPCNPEPKALSIASFPDCQPSFTPPAPPPPPPPPPHVQFPSGIASRASCSSTLPNLSSPRNSDSSEGLNQNPQNDLPLQSPSGIPPPPCPSPFLKGNINSVKGPPPPPSLLPIYTPMGKNGSPLPKLKPLHWDKVRAAPDRSMVWDKLRSSSFELDEEMIESLFGYNLQNSMKNDETKSTTPSPSKHVLEPKRLQNITILSKALNVTAEQVCNALVQGNGLCLQQLEALAKMVPTKEEEAKLSSYKGDIKELGSAEQFVGAMLKIPFAFLRIEAMLYKETFEDEVVLLRKSFSMLEEACKELRSSRLFLKLLEAVLKTGNRMNVGTIRGGARAFKLDALLKLADVKGTDGKTTLLHFVVQEIIRSEGIRVSDSIMGKISQKNKTKSVEEREEDYRRMGLDLVSGLSTELYNVKKTATIDLDVLASSVSNLSAEMAKLQHLVHKDLSMDEKSGTFVQSMRFFLNYAEKNLKELKDDEDRVLLHVREITEYFHGHMSKDEANPLRIFVIVRDFLGMLDHVCKELRSLKITSSPNPLASFR